MGTDDLDHDLFLRRVKASPMLLIQASLVTVVPKTCVKTIGFIVLTVLVIVLV